MKNATLFLLLVICGSTLVAQNVKTENFVKVDNRIEAEYFHDNGVLAQTGSYNAKNQLDGLWSSYNDQGYKLSQGHYSNGKKVGIWTFFQDEKLVLVAFENSRVVQVTDLKISDNPVVTRFDRD